MTRNRTLFQRMAGLWDAFRSAGHAADAVRRDRCSRAQRPGAPGDQRDRLRRDQQELTRANGISADAPCRAAPAGVCHDHRTYRRAHRALDRRLSHHQRRRRGDRAAPRSGSRTISAGSGCTRPISSASATAEAGRARSGGPEHVVEGWPQRQVEVGHRDRQAEVDEAGHAVVADAAGHDAGEVPELGLDVDRDAVEATQRRTRTPIAAILSSAGLPSGCGGRSGRTTQTPTRPCRRSPLTSNAASARITHSSSARRRRARRGRGG